MESIERFPLCEDEQFTTDTNLTTDTYTQLNPNMVVEESDSAPEPSPIFLKTLRGSPDMKRCTSISEMSDLMSDAVTLASEIDSWDNPDVGFFQHVKNVLRYIGPGALVAMAYVDPGNLEGDLSAGALRSPQDPLLGYKLLWLLPVATLFGLIFQTLTIKVATKTGHDVAVLCRYLYPRPIQLTLWVLTELCIVGADMQSVIGCAIALNLILGLPFSVGCLITLIDVFIFIPVRTYGIRVFEKVFFVAIGIMVICFFATFITSKPNWTAIAHGVFIPRIPPDTLKYGVGLVGSVVMPHNIFLQSAVVLSRPINHSSKREVRRVNRIYFVENTFVLTVSMLVNIAVAAAFANPLINPEGKELNLQNAHKALAAVIGKWSLWVWAIGLLAAGQCSTLACTYAGQLVMSGFLNLNLDSLVRVLMARSLSLVPLILILNLSSASLEIVATVVNILQAAVMPFVVVVVIRIAKNKYIMGNDSAISGAWVVFFGTCMMLLLSANVCLFGFYFNAKSPLFLLTLCAMCAGLGILAMYPLKNLESLHGWDTSSREFHLLPQIHEDDNDSQTTES